MKILRK
jgi:hypothetical protein